MSYLFAEGLNAWDSVRDVVGGVGRVMDSPSQNQYKVTMSGELYRGYRVGLRVAELLGNGSSNRDFLLARTFHSVNGGALSSTVAHEAI